MCDKRIECVCCGSTFPYENKVIKKCPACRFLKSHSKDYDYDYVIDVPQYQKDEIKKIKKLKDIHIMLNSKYYIEALAKEMGCKVNYAKFLFKVDKFHKNPISLSDLNISYTTKGNVNIFKNQLTILKNPIDELLECELVTMIDTLLTQLNEREQAVIRMRFGLLEDKSDRTLDEIASALGVSVSRIRNIETSAMKKLKHPKFSSFIYDYLYDANVVAKKEEEIKSRELEKDKSNNGELELIITEDENNVYVELYQMMGNEGEIVLKVKGKQIIEEEKSTLKISHIDHYMLNETDLDNHKAMTNTGMITLTAISHAVSETNFQEVIFEKDLKETSNIGDFKAVLKIIKNEYSENTIKDYYKKLFGDAYINNTYVINGLIKSIIEYNNECGLYVYKAHSFLVNHLYKSEFWNNNVILKSSYLEYSEKRLRIILDLKEQKRNIKNTNKTISALKTQLTKVVSLGNNSKDNLKLALKEIDLNIEEIDEFNIYLNKIKEIINE